MAVTCSDAAEVYGPFVHEALLGEALAPARNDVIAATQVGLAKASLTRLETDGIDPFFQQRLDLLVLEELGIEFVPNRFEPGRSRPSAPGWICSRTSVAARLRRPAQVAWGWLLTKKPGVPGPPRVRCETRTRARTRRA